MQFSAALLTLIKRDVFVFPSEALCHPCEDKGHSRRAEPAGSAASSPAIVGLGACRPPSAGGICRSMISSDCGRPCALRSCKSERQGGRRPEATTTRALVAAQVPQGLTLRRKLIVVWARPPIVDLFSASRPSIALAPQAKLEMLPCAHHSPAVGVPRPCFLRQ